MNIRAKKGGEKGVNGDWYEGGQYLPNSQNTVKGSLKSKKGNSRSIASLIKPGVREVVPEGYCSIFQRVMLFVNVNEDSTLTISASDTAIEYHFDNREEIEQLVELYNQGNFYYPIQ